MGLNPTRKIISLPRPRTTPAIVVNAAQKPAGIVRAGEAAPMAAAEKRPPATLPGTPDAALIAAARARLAARDQAIDWLAATYPIVFGADVKPLAIGVGREIWAAAKAAGITRKALDAALSRRTSSATYLEELARDDAVRFDLAGNPAELVSAQHRLRAIELGIAQLERTQTKFESSKRSEENDKT